jgi:dihydrofolate reductase
MRRILLIVHTSLDGFVAGPTGEFDGFEASEENLAFVCELTRDADAVLAGRKTFELLDGDWPTKKDRPNVSLAESRFSAWYNSAKKIVISKNPGSKSLKNALVVGNDISREISDLKNTEGRNIMLFGSPSAAQTLIGLGLIDDYWIFVNPVIFGEGIPLFTRLPGKIRLRIIEMRQFANGELAIHYELDHPSPGNVRSRY